MGAVEIMACASMHIQDCHDAYFFTPQDAQKYEVIPAPNEQQIFGKIRADGAPGRGADTTLYCAQQIENVGVCIVMELAGIHPGPDQVLPRRRADSNLHPSASGVVPLQ
ncbi:MAG TPA: hypothetical protein VGE29_16220 [Prosthecobacter sp.]